MNKKELIKRILAAESPFFYSTFLRNVSYLLVLLFSLLMFKIGVIENVDSYMATSMAFIWLLLSLYIIAFRIQGMMSVGVASLLFASIYKSNKSIIDFKQSYGTKKARYVFCKSERQKEKEDYFFR